MRKSLLITAVLLFSFLWSESFALPRFSAKVEQKCNLCHINPTGGGMRNAFGSQYFAQTELAVHKVSLDSITRFNPMLSENISVGMDMRTLYTYDRTAKQSSFFQMEGNLYLDAQLGDRLSLTISKGLYTGFDIFGMAYVLPLQGYVKVGKFQPSYGWRFSDHTSFVREGTLWPPNLTDTGMEIGLYPYGISANIGFFNGSAGQFDDDNGKALSARFEFRRHVSIFGFGMGGSYWRNDRDNGAINMYGPLFYLNSLDARLIYLGELDWLENRFTNITTFATTHNIGYMISQGIWLEAQYDFRDPDIDIKGGAISRYSFGVDYFPTGFLEIEPSLKYFEDDFSADGNYAVFYNQFHFFF